MTVVLRPIREDEIDEAVARRTAAAPVDAERMRARFARSGELHDGMFELAIELDGRLAGDIQARTDGAQQLPPGVFEIGVELYDPGQRGRGAGTSAVRAFVSRVFSELGAARVQASTAVGNAAMRRVLERCGFRLEGVMRSFWPAGDDREDYALYAITREEGFPPPAGGME